MTEGPRSSPLHIPTSDLGEQSALEQTKMLKTPSNLVSADGISHAVTIEKNASQIPTGIFAATHKNDATKSAESVWDSELLHLDQSSFLETLSLTHSR